MFFKPEMRQKILEGRKTVTRRIWSRPMVKMGGIYQVRKSFYKPGYYFKIKVLSIRKEKLGEMTEQDAMYEGFNSLAEFKAYFIELNSKKTSFPTWDKNQEVYVIYFKLMPELR